MSRRKLCDVAFADQDSGYMYLSYENTTYSLNDPFAPCKVHGYCFLFIYINDFINCSSIFHLFAEDSNLFYRLIKIYSILRKLSIGNSVNLIHAFVQTNYLLQGSAINSSTIFRTFSVLRLFSAWE